MKSIAVLLTVFNRKKKTLACLESIFIQNKIPGVSVDIFLVDDGSTDGTAEAVKKIFPEVNVIEEQGNLFWNRGMRTAWSAALKQGRFDYYLWLNDDTFLEEYAIKNLVETSLDFEDKSIIVGTTCAFNNSQEITYGGRSKVKGLLTPKEFPVECDYFNGNIVLIPYYVYELVGTNDPIFSHALGDFDYGLRAKRKGVKAMIAPGILGQCDNHTSLSVWCNPKKTLIQRWRAFRSPLGNNPEEFFIFEKRHGGVIKAILHYISNHFRVFFPGFWVKKNL